MKVAFYMNCVSTHQLPLAKEVAELVGAENFRYIDAGEKGQAYQSGEVQGLKFKVQRIGDAAVETAAVRGESAREWLETADVMLTGMRDLELFERRARKGMRTYYASERWWKPVRIVRIVRLFDCDITREEPLHQLDKVLLLRPLPNQCHLETLKPRNLHLPHRANDRIHPLPVQHPPAP